MNETLLKRYIDELLDVALSGTPEPRDVIGLCESIADSRVYGLLGLALLLRISSSELARLELRKAEIQAQSAVRH